MATEYALETFNDIKAAIMEAMGIQVSDVTAGNKIKRMINLYYLNEVVPFKRWTWLQKNIQVVHYEYYNVDTVEVTPDSTTITFATAPNISEGSFAGWRFAIDGSNKVYTIATHTAASTTAVLTSAYQEDLDATAEFKVWRDRIDLPVNAKETIQITHAEQGAPLRALGPKDFRKLESGSPKGEGFPYAYNTDTFYNPSGELSDDERYRQVRLYPSITPTPVTLSIDYIEEATSLVEDTDEPIIPVEDRIVLYYGAGAQAWSVLQRNEDMADRWLAKANAKLARMAGDRDDGFDAPKLAPESTYINSQRNSGLRKKRIGFASMGGQSSVSLPSYLRDVTIAGANITADITVADDILIDGVDISTLAAFSIPAEATLTDDTINGVVEAWELDTYDVIHLNYSITRGAALLEAGHITIAGVAASASVAQGSVVNVGGDIGVTFSADTSGTTVRLLYTASATGIDAEMKYSAFKWLA